MTEDVYIEKIKEVKPHDNADRLEVARVRNWDCIVGKGEFKPGDLVIYIQPDAVIAEKIDPNSIYLTESPSMYEDYLSNRWADRVRSYLGNGNRVKTVNLRGKTSYGLIIKLEDAKDDLINNISYYNALKFGCEDETFNDAFNSWREDAKADWNDHFDELIELINERLDVLLGITHYVAPIPQDFNALREGLPIGVEKSDETNYQALTDEELHLGEEVLVTRKMDGSSGTIYYNPHTEEFGVYSRSLELKTECVNNYTVAMLPLKDAIFALGKHYNEPIALRGEVCGMGIQSKSINPNCKGTPTFFIYGVRFPENENETVRMGYWKSGRHFVDVVQQANELGFKNLKTVACLGNAVITKEQLQKWADAPAKDGEGVVVNGTSFSYKIRSAEYDAKM